MTRHALRIITIGIICALNSPAMLLFDMSPKVEAFTILFTVYLAGNRILIVAIRLF